MNPKKLITFKTSHINTSTGFKPVKKQMRLISEVTIDLFVDYWDEDAFVKYKVEHLQPKKLFDEMLFHLN